MDLINRQDVVDAIVTWTVEDRPDIEMPIDLVNRINVLPSTERKGEWIFGQTAGQRFVKCSHCGHIEFDDIPNYCKDCRVRMVSKE